eukprot:690860-Pelagomonas_calceolata.AAC.3
MRRERGNAQLCHWAGKQQWVLRKVWQPQSGFREWVSDGRGRHRKRGQSARCLYRQPTFQKWPGGVPGLYFSNIKHESLFLSGHLCPS